MLCYGKQILLNFECFKIIDIIDSSEKYFYKFMISYIEILIPTTQYIAISVYR